MPNEGLKDKAYTIIREKLINCEYEPGTILNEMTLAEELGFSRTPIREALNRIEQERFIKIMPKKGILVVECTLSDVIQIFQTRLEIEPVALRMAGPFLPKEKLLEFREMYLCEQADEENGFRIDTAMHMFIIEHCGNRFIIDMMRKVFDENTRVIISSRQYKTKIHEANEEHIEILNSLIYENYEKAADLMREHIKACRESALDFFCSVKPFQANNVVYGRIV